MKYLVWALVSGQLLFSSYSVSAQTFASVPPGQYLEHLYDRSVLFDTAATVVIEPAPEPDPQEAWRSWRMVTNYSYGKNRGSLPMIADLQALHPYFRDKVLELVRVCREAGIVLAVVESYRTPAKQAEYYAMGRKYTSSPGGKSRHQYGLAVDVVPLVDSVAVWDNARLWRKIGLAGERLGLRWGGRWRVLYDPGHFEWPGGLTRQQLAKGLMPAIPPSAKSRYPALAEDLRILQASWNAWEVEQGSIARGGAASGDGEETVAGVGN